MFEDDWSRRADEIEALTAIYAEQFHSSDEKSFTIDIDDGRLPSQFKLSVEVTLPSDYPSSSPPQYQLSAPWLRGDERNRICGELENIYCDNIGECIIFKWVEALREFVLKKTDLSESRAESNASSQDLSEKTSAEEHSEENDEDYLDEYGFDPKLHVHIPSKSDASDSINNIDGIQLPEIHHGEIIKDRRSIFQGHLAHVVHKAQTKMVMDSLLESKKIADATHNIVAYRICCDGGAMMTGCEDDGETHAGSRMLHLLDIVDAKNVMIVVTRWYGGVHLGPDRFKHINNCTRQLLEQHGYIKDKNTDKKGPKSHTGQPSLQDDSQKLSQRHGKKNK